MATSDDTPEKESTVILINRLKDIASAVMTAAEAGTLEQVFERIAHVAGELVNARYAALGIPDNSGGLKFFKVAGLSAEQIAHIGHLPHGKGLLGAIMEERTAVRLVRMQEDARSSGFCERHPSMTSLLGVPVQLGDRVFGILYLCDKRDGQPFTEQDQWLVETIAGYAALAIVGSQLGEQQSRLALLEERERVSMELHDSVIQSLYAIGMHMQLVSLGGAAQEAELKPAMRDLDRVIEDIRRFILNLKISSYRQRTMYEAMRDVLVRLHIPENVQVEIDAPDIQPMISEVTFEAVCQMAHEAISNALRHANPTLISIVSRLDANTFSVVITDNGQGFDLELDKRAASGGLGLQNLQRRAQLHGGHVDIVSTPGHGTRLTISVPTQPV